MSTAPLSSFLECGENDEVIAVAVVDCGDNAGLVVQTVFDIDPDEPINIEV